MEQQWSRSETPAMSEDIRAIAQAILLARKEFVATGRTGNNTRFGKYAKIEDIYHAVEDSLSKNNIIIVHFLRPDHRPDLGHQEILYTRLIHTLTGQFIEDSRVLLCEAPGNQEKGKANTYCKRYALLSLCAIPTEDDDAQSEQKFIDEPYISPEQLVYLQKEIKSAANGLELLNNIVRFNKVKDLPLLKVSQFEGVKAHIAKNRK